MISLGCKRTSKPPSGCSYLEGMLTSEFSFCTADPLRKSYPSRLKSGVLCSGPTKNQQSTSSCKEEAALRLLREAPVSRLNRCSRRRCLRSGCSCAWPVLEFSRVCFRPRQGPKKIVAPLERLSSLQGPAAIHNGRRRRGGDRWRHYGRGEPDRGRLESIGLAWVPQAESRMRRRARKNEWRGCRRGSRREISLQERLGFERAGMQGCHLGLSCSSTGNISLDFLLLSSSPSQKGCEIKFVLKVEKQIEQQMKDPYPMHTHLGTS